MRSEPSGYATGLAIQKDGKIVAAGFVYGRDFALTRYNTNGSVDTSFGSGGTVLTDFSGSGSDEAAMAIALQNDRKVVAAGFSNASGNGDFALARYNP